MSKILLLKGELPFIWPNYFLSISCLKQDRMVSRKDTYMWWGQLTHVFMSLDNNCSSANLTEKLRSEQVYSFLFHWTVEGLNVPPQYICSWLMMFLHVVQTTTTKEQNIFSSFCFLIEMWLKKKLALFVYESVKFCLPLWPLCDILSTRIASSLAFLQTMCHLAFRMTFKYTCVHHPVFKFIKWFVLYLG